MRISDTTKWIVSLGISAAAVVYFVGGKVTAIDDAVSTSNQADQKADNALLQVAEMKGEVDAMYRGLQKVGVISVNTLASSTTN